ncbi:MAG: hypothetical protein V8S95_08190 [Odoribacter sp.]
MISGCATSMPTGKKRAFVEMACRCIVDLARRLEIFSTTTHFLAVDGPHEGRITGFGIQVKMQNVSQIIQTANYFFLHTGSPHYVKIVQDAFQTDVCQEGKIIRYSAGFQPEGTNVNFITPTPEYIKIATCRAGG